jgi:hypothetical protein
LEAWLFSKPWKNTGRTSAFLLTQKTWEKTGVEMVIFKALEEYRKNMVTTMVFLLLGLFVLAFSLFAGTYLSSGTVFLEYNLFSSNPIEAFAQIVLAVLYLAFFAVFLVVMIFAVRQSMAKVKFATYLRDFVPKFSFELFEFLLVFSVVFFLLGYALVSVGVPVVLVAFLFFVAAALLSFVPQSIVVDELAWIDAVPQSLHFFFSNIGLVLFVLAVSVVLIAVLPFIELFFDQFWFIGRFVSLVLLLVFVLPFIETLKTVSYLSKYDLIRNLF